MDTLDKTQRFSRTIPCGTCGEMYSVTYKRCPFCGGSPVKRPEQNLGNETTDYDMTIKEMEMDETDMPPVRSEKGGKRLKKESGSGVFVKILLFLLSLAIVVAAAYIVITKVVPIVQNRFGTEEPNSQTSNGEQNQTTDPVVEPEEEKTEFRLLQTKATLTTQGETKQLEVVFEPEEEQSDLTWSSSNDEVVKVDQNGKLTAVAPGTAIVTATKEDGMKAQCEVQCIWDDSAENVNITLNRVDFTLKKGESFKMQVIGTEETPIWSVKDPKIATISESGVVKYVAKGDTTITATVGNQTLTCIVRCSG